jgi:6-phosphogluconate dehydrogenase
VWSNTEADKLHIPAPTLNVAHAFCLASAYLGDRESAKNVLGGGWPPQKIVLDAEQKAVFIEDLRKATVATCLASYT